MQTHPHHHHRQTDDVSAEKLQGLLRAEMSAVETYELALKSINHVALHRTLQEILASHSRRVEQIRARVASLGAEPVKSSGVWGAFAKAFQAGADLLGDRVAIAALEEGEDHVLALYGEGLAKFDLKTQQLIQNELAPAQRRTHELCRMLKSYMKAPS